MHKRNYLVFLLAGAILSACQTSMIPTPSSSYLLTVLPPLAIAPGTTPSETAPLNLPGIPIFIPLLASTPFPTLENYFLPPMPAYLDATEIQLSKIPCYGTCPEYAVTIYGDGRVVYSGKQYVGIKGEREYFIPREQVETLVALFYEYGFFFLAG